MCPVLLLWGALLLQGGLEDLGDLVFDGVGPQRIGVGDPHGGGKVPSHRSSDLPVSAALAKSAGSEVGRQAWAGLAALVRRPFRRTVPEPAGNGPPRASSGELELAALQEDSTELNRAQVLVTALHVRAALDEKFRVRLEEWWQRAQAAGGEVHHSVSGGTQNGPVIQGRDFSNLTFHMTCGTEKPDRE